MVKREIEVKAVNRKPKFPKFNSGSVKLMDDTWLSVDKGVAIDLFQENGKYTVETVTEKGFEKIVSLVLAEKVKLTPVVPVGQGDFMKRQHPEVEKRIIRQGLVQAAAGAPGLMGYAKTYDDYKHLTKDYFEFLLSLVEGESK